MVYIGAGIALLSPRNGGVGFQPQSINLEKLREMCVSTKDKSHTRVRSSHRLSSPFGLAYGERDAIRHVEGVLIRHAQRERARSFHVQAGVADGLLQGDNQSGYHQRDQPDENKIA